MIGGMPDQGDKNKKNAIGFINLRYSTKFLIMMHIVLLPVGTVHKMVYVQIFADEL